jgi:hypothetical protein
MWRSRFAWRALELPGGWESVNTTDLASLSSRGYKLGQDAENDMAHPTEVASRRPRRPLATTHVPLVSHLYSVHF